MVLIAAGRDVTGHRLYVMHLCSVPIPIPCLALLFARSFVTAFQILKSVMPNIFISIDTFTYFLGRYGPGSWRIRKLVADGKFRANAQYIELP